MLSQKTITIVKSTAPILEKQGETLTKHFYKRMFSNNPEVKPLFNPAHQAVGAQQKALAGAICAYAANIDNLDVLGGAIELIAQKHASLHVEAKDYPVVGMNLLGSIKEVLGDAATVDIIDAWQEAYEFLAKILIGREQQIYLEQKSQPGGWEGFKNFTVVKKEKESSNITSFYLSPMDNKLPLFKPGQYITVRVPGPNGYTTMRNYSLSGKPGEKLFRISVKREDGLEKDDPKGYVSNYLHDDINIDSVLEIGPPSGEFYLDITENHDKPLVLLAAGIGITPILSILQTALDSMPHREIIFIHGVLNEGVQAFKRTIDNLAEIYSNLKVHYRYSEPNNTERLDLNVSIGFIDSKIIESLVSHKNADYYFCGPKLFMINIYHELLIWGIPASQVHFEFFGPLQRLTSGL
ncbi:MAG: NO-inducible flavohemoprotein [Gammaproteobacteria bacterium]|nr:NO-inducible flavohemoprotein [Gammaproteobacteria bacterium]